MLANFHTHSTFCDGKNTPEEIVLAALEKGFVSIGFSSHGYTPYDLRYCMKDTDGYIADIKRLKDKYRGDIQIYLGIEEDAFAPVDRSKFDYIIGASHYFVVGQNYFPIDSGYDHFKRCLEVFHYDINRMAHIYFGSLCEYINAKHCNIIGHFDLITKFSEKESDLFYGNTEYDKIAEAYVREAIKSDPIFEINTGAVTRGIRSTVYPNENLLHVLKKENARIILGSDSHEIATLDGYFAETQKYLYDIGFRSSYILYNREFVPVDLI